MPSQASRQAPGEPGRQETNVFLAKPAVALVTVFFVIPLGMTAWMSLNNWPLMGEHSFVGLDNYFAILRDTRFWNALRFTAYYTVIVTIATLLRLLTNWLSLAR